MTDQVKRKEFFYKIRSENLADPSDQTQPFDAAQACEQIAKLHFKVKKDRYHFFGDGDSVAVTPKMDKSRPRMVLFKTRRSGWPEFEDEGEFAPISSDDGKDGKGIAEKTHITFFENAIVGAEFNFHGPRIRSLSHYLQAKTPGRYFHPFDGIINRDLIGRLERMGEVNLIHLQIRKAYLKLLSERTPGTIGALRAMSEDLIAPVVGLTLKSEGRSKGGLGSSAMGLIRAIVGMPEVMSGLESFKVRAKTIDTGKVEPFDLLMDQFVSVVTVARTSKKHKIIDSSDMFDKIDKSYEELIPLLESSPSIST